MDEQNTKLELVKKRCNTADKVVNILMVVAIVAAAVTLLAGLFMFAEADRVNPFLEQGIKDGSITIRDIADYDGPFQFYFDLDDYTGPVNYAHYLGFTILMACVSCILVAVVLSFIRKIFICIREENNPFSDRCLKQLKTTFIVIAVAALISYSVVVAAVTAVILWCIYAVFQYGAALQMQVDETL